MLQEGLQPPTLGLFDPCSTKLSYQSCILPTLGIEPRTFTYSDKHSPNCATWALTNQVLEIGSKTNVNGPLVKISTAKPKCSAVMQSIPVILLGAPRRVSFLLDKVNNRVTNRTMYVREVAKCSPTHRSTDWTQLCQMECGVAILV